MKFGLLFWIGMVAPLFLGAQGLYFPPNNDNWEEMDPVSELDWCPDRMLDLQNYLAENNTKAFIILKGGKIALEWYFDDFTKDSSWYWASAGKTMTAALIGKAQEEGLLDIQAPSHTYLGAGWSDMTPAQEEAVTVWHHLTMTTGLDFNVPEQDCTDPECLKYLSPPGTQWYYHNAAYTLLFYMVNNVAGMHPSLYYRNRIGQPIGAGGLYFKLGDNQVFISKPRDMARFGLLIQAKGKWNGQTILSETAYINAATHPSQDINESYGYLWWLNGQESHRLPGTTFTFNGPIIPTAPADLFAGLGANDQKLYVVPSEDMVVVRMGDSAGDITPGLSNFDTPLWQKIGDLACSSQTDLTAQNDGFIVFPNPAGSVIQVADKQLRNGTLEVVDILGEVVMTRAFQGEATLDINSFVPGFYHIILRHERGESRQTFIKK